MRSLLCAVSAYWGRRAIGGWFTIFSWCVVGHSNIRFCVASVRLCVCVFGLRRRRRRRRVWRSDRDRARAPQQTRFGFRDARLQDTAGAGRLLGYRARAPHQQRRQVRVKSRLGQTARALQNPIVCIKKSILSIGRCGSFARPHAHTLSRTHTHSRSHQHSRFVPQRSRDRVHIDTYIIIPSYITRTRRVSLCAKGATEKDILVYTLCPCLYTIDSTLVNQMY